MFKTALALFNSNLWSVSPVKLFTEIFKLPIRASLGTQVPATSVGRITLAVGEFGNPAGIV